MIILKWRYWTIDYSKSRSQKQIYPTEEKFNSVSVAEKIVSIPLTMLLVVRYWL